MLRCRDVEPVLATPTHEAIEPGTRHPVPGTRIFQDVERVN